ncbi:MAG: site-2 protease family protein [Clostridia bacterium]|nr:site-2 protease family protein [Clostridia bacterium]
MRKYLQSPIFILLIAMVVLNLLEGDFDNMGEWIMGKLLMIPAIVIGLSFHEFAHAAVSNALGDPTPKSQGRVTINPMAHIDPFGFVALFIAGFGWGQPVQIDPRYYKNRRLGEILVSFAGVAMNLLLAIVFAFVIKAYLNVAGNIGNVTLAHTILEMLIDIVVVNIVLMIFNLLPVPPLDGFGVVTQLFRLDRYDWWYKLYNNGFLILMLLILFGVTNKILQPAVSAVYGMIMGAIL